MGKLSAYLIQRRMAQIFSEGLQETDVIEVFLEDISAYLRVWPAQVAAIVSFAEGRRAIERIALESGYRIRVAYRPGIIRAFAR